MPQLGDRIVRVVRTYRLLSGVRSLWLLPDGTSVHAIEDNPIPPGTYFLRPDDSGRFRNWVIESELYSAIAVQGDVENPLGRRNIEVHLGNTLADTRGCICPGTGTNATGVSNSRIALRHMREVLARNDLDPPIWVLEIKGGGYE